MPRNSDPQLLGEGVPFPSSALSRRGFHLPRPDSSWSSAVHGKQWFAGGVASSLTPLFGKITEMCLVVRRFQVLQGCSSWLRCVELLTTSADALCCCSACGP